MEHKSNEPLAATLDPTTSPALFKPRKDGWTGEKMAMFCEALADCAIVADACGEVGMHVSGAYALRRRNPVFARGWDAALTIARERLADTLLARSIEGNAELIYRDGELVGRRDMIDNRLGLAILGRLDRLAETGRASAARIVPAQPRPNAPAIVHGEIDWDLVLEALRTRDPDDVAGALALLNSLESNEVEEVEDPRNADGEGDDEGIDLSDRIWKDGIEDQWLTDFPPPAGFTGYQSCDYGDPDQSYERECTPAEIAAIEADAARAAQESLAEDEELRDNWFEFLIAEARAAGIEPSSPAEVEDARTAPGESEAGLA
jgi:hypothetical protein